MTSTPKKPQRTSKKVVHICSKEETIERQGVLLERLGKVTLGNGTPENGLMFMFREFLENDKRRKEDIQVIKESLKGVNENHNVLIREITIVGSELNSFKETIEARKETEEEITEKLRKASEVLATKKRDTRFIIFQVIALTLTLAGVSAAVYFGFHTDKTATDIKSETRVTNDILDNGQTRGGGQNYIPPAFRTDTIK